MNSYATAARQRALRLIFERGPDAPLVPRAEPAPCLRVRAARPPPREPTLDELWQRMSSELWSDIQ